MSSGNSELAEVLGLDIQTFEVEGLQSMTDYLTKIVEYAPDSYLEKRHLLSLCGLAHAQCFGLSGLACDLERAISYFEQVIQIAADAVPEKHEALFLLGSMLVSRFWLLKRTADFDKALDFYRRGLELVYASDFDASTCLFILKFVEFGEPCLTALAKACFVRFLQGGDSTSAGLDRSIILLEQLTTMIPDHDADKPGLLAHLGLSTELRFTRSMEINDLDKAILFHEQAAELFSDEDPAKYESICRIGFCEGNRFLRTRDPEILDSAIVALNIAVALMPDDHHTKLDCFIHLSNVTRMRFNQYHNFLDLDTAVNLLHDAGELIGEDHPQRPSYLNALANTYYMRFCYLNRRSDIENAIRASQDAVSMCPTESFLQALCLNYALRFDAYGESEDLERAMELQQQAHQLVYPDDPSTKSSLCFGSLFSIRYDHFKDPSDNEAAVQAFSEAVDRATTDNPDMVDLLLNLATALSARFERLGREEDINEAIAHGRRALKLIPGNHPSRPHCLYKLGKALGTRYTGKQLLESACAEDLDEALLLLQRASTFTYSPPVHRLAASAEWRLLALTARANTTNEQIFESFEVTMDLVPQIPWLGGTIRERHTFIAFAPVVVPIAAMTAVQCGRPDRAVEWLEQGRSVIWGQQLNLRMPMDCLKAANPVLADEFVKVTRALDNASSRREDTFGFIKDDYSAEPTSQSHRRLAEKWDELLAKVRQIPGFDEFLLPKRLDQLWRASRHGPVVMLNVSKQCDALILLDGTDDVVHLPLPDFSKDKADKLLKELRSMLKSSGVRARGSMPCYGIRWGGGCHRILSTLWTSVVKPVLETLRFSIPTSGTALPRIIWCPTGALSFLPIHAAGLYDTDEPGNKLSDFAISSYTTTVSALLESSTNAPAHEFQGILAVSQPNTPNLSPLPSTENEIQQIEKYAGADKLVWLDRSLATKDAVQEHMASTSWIHLACHAIQHPDPLKSAFCLADGQLELGNIISQTHGHAEFAFLSACQTATGDEELSDEAVHLAAAMQLAGYRSVIATMWSIRDKDAPLIADEVYKHLLRDKTPDSTQAAAALYHAVLRLRQETRPEKLDDDWFLRWVPFIHMGV